MHGSIRLLALVTALLAFDPAGGASGPRSLPTDSAPPPDPAGDPLPAPAATSGHSPHQGPTHPIPDALPSPATPSTRTAHHPTDSIPSSCRSPEARRFDFWIGEWDVLNRTRAAEDAEWRDTGRATNRVYAVAGGCAVVEHWRGHAFGTFIVGFSIRAWNPETERWDLALLWPGNGRPRWGVLHGGFRHGRGRFTASRPTPDGDTVLTRYTFSDIRSDALRWQNATSRDGGRTWSSTWIMEFSRRDPTGSTGLWNGPSATTLRCPGETHRAFDSLRGGWRGRRVHSTGARNTPDRDGRDPGTPEAIRPATRTPDTTEIRMEAIPILEGCAMMERIYVPGGAWEVVRVRSWEPHAGRWTEYRIDAERGRLERRESAPADATEDYSWVFVATDGERRTRWHASDGRPPAWAEEVRDGSGGWRPLYSVELTERLGPA